jgi:hypothetical protein
VNLKAIRLVPFVAALLVASCGGDSGAATPTLAPGATPVSPTATNGVPATIDACTLLSDAEIAAATAQNVVNRQLSALRPDVFPSICDIELDGGGSLTVSIRATGGRSLYETSFEPFFGDADGYLEEAVIGLGD